MPPELRMEAAAPIKGNPDGNRCQTRRATELESGDAAELQRFWDGRTTTPPPLQTPCTSDCDWEAEKPFLFRMKAQEAVRKRGYERLMEPCNGANYLSWAGDQFRWSRTQQRHLPTSPLPAFLNRMRCIRRNHPGPGQFPLRVSYMIAKIGGP